jgi:hypothetical protein
MGLIDEHMGCTNDIYYMHEMIGQLHAPAALHPGTHWIGGWLGPRAGLDNMEIETNQAHTSYLQIHSFGDALIMLHLHLHLHHHHHHKPMFGELQ